MGRNDGDDLVEEIAEQLTCVNSIDYCYVLN